MFKAILFDLNGVLIDSEELNKYVWKKVFENYNLKFDEKLYTEIIDGRTTKEIAQDFVESERILEFIELKDRLWYELFEKKGICVFDETVSYLEKLKSQGIKIAVITSSRKVKYILKKLNLMQYFDVIIGGEDIVCGKPNPEIILKAIHFLNLEPSEVALVEDSIAGLEAGRRAGVHCIAIKRNEEDTFVEYNQLVTNLEEIKL